MTQKLGKGCRNGAAGLIPDGVALEVQVADYPERCGEVGQDVVVPLAAVHAVRLQGIFCTLTLLTMRAVVILRTLLRRFYLVGTLSLIVRVGGMFSSTPCLHA